MRKLFLIFFAGLLSCNMLLAQGVQLPDDPIRYKDVVTDAFLNSQNEEMIAMAQNFSNDWSSLDIADKKTAIKLTQNMLDTGYSFYSEVYRFFHILSKADKLSGMIDRTTIINTTQKVFQNHSKSDLNKYLDHLHDFADHKALYYSPNYGVYSEGNVSLEYVEVEESSPEPFEEPVDEVASDDEEQKEDGWFDDWDNWEEDEEEPADNEDTWATGWEEEEKEKQNDDVSPAAISTLIQVVVPEVTGPVLRFEKTFLKFTSNYDTVFIKNTSGSVMMFNNMLVANGGSFDWSPAGLDPDEIYATFGDYYFDISKPKIESQKVKLTYKSRLEEPVEGVFEYKLQRRSKNGKPTYPRFKSYSNNIYVKGFKEKNLEYKGGFSLRGKQILSTPVFPGLGRIEVKINGQKYFKAYSNIFELSDSIISSPRAGLVIYHDRDSITHPALKVKYDLDSMNLTVLSNEGAFKSTAFKSSLFNMEFKAELIEWDLKSDSLNVSRLTAKNKLPVEFESEEFFSTERFGNLTGLMDTNPLLRFVYFARKRGSGSFYTYEVAEFMKESEEKVRGYAHFLMRNGFIEFNPNTGYIEISRKGYHYVLSDRGRKDYDNLTLESISPDEPNATLRINKDEMIVRGVERFIISKSLKVYVEPDSQTIVLLRNRDLLFDGIVNAGNIQYIGKEFRFNYDSFLIDMPQIDKIRFNLDSDQPKGYRARQRKSIGNELQETAGTLFINKPNNKSALRDYPSYPKFSGSRGATVYFDSPDVLDGAYDKSVYFSVPTFDLDSVSGSDTKALTFKGTFYSDIFPPFEETLKLMPDNSLGFVHNTPEDGYQLYEGDGKIYSDITLNSQGLTADGRIEYLAADVYASDFTFYMDSVSAPASRVEIAKGDDLGPSVPAITSADSKFRWDIPTDSMNFTNLSEPINLYDNTATLTGTAVYSKHGGFGRGKLKTRGSVTQSTNISFSEYHIGARNAGFIIESSNPEKPALRGEDVKLDFDLTNNIADIQPEEEGVAALDFPFAQFKTSITKATWDLSNQQVSMLKPADVPIENSYFYTTREELDSLAFNATKAEYDINDLTLNIFGIPYIKIADAKVTPDDNKLLIRENATLDRLHNATIVVDTLNEYHTLIDGEIDIISRRKFEGKATYRYINALSDTFNIEFGEFSLQEYSPEKNVTKLRTVASGNVDVAENFLISPGFYFKGKVTMYANKEVLELNGAVRLDMSTGESDWIVYNSDAQIKDIVFDFDEATTEAGKRLKAGIFYETGTDYLYSIFVKDKLTPDDLPFFQPSGMLSYNRMSKTYEIVDFEKLQGNSYQGQKYTYDDESGQVTFEGKLNYLAGNQDFNMKSAGRGSGVPEKGEMEVSSMVGLNAQIDDNILEAIGSSFRTTADAIGTPEALSNLSEQIYYLSEFVSDKGAKAFEERALNEYTPLAGFDREVDFNIFLTNLNMKWDNDNKAWYNNGTVGVSHLGRQDVNTLINGFVEFKKDPDGNESFNVFAQLTPGHWFFFQYEEGVLLMLSSDDKINAEIKERSEKNSKKMGAYTQTIAELSEVTDFIDRFRKDYLGINTPYTLEFFNSQPNVPVQAVPFGSDSEAQNTDSEDDDEDTGF
ncbi:hypothetical protein OO013_13390 [Mangrovivirga sp. M17]|uniref:Uncharacterized protein n=1 Tax=Mangrovivirga halotolerans TaxID=2993936 RepID=A0ABT3RTB7_9BACT|nr:hypothetical protein [Mangrovivirga halotolerans]MCX2744870.1 hypothetical protein [Mangrovivirga halotolerans]